MLRVRESPAQREQAIELDACSFIVRDPAPTSRAIEAAEDLYANKIRAFLRVTLPLSLPGVVAGTLLTFIPAAGDFINAQLLGGPKNHMIGNVIQSKFLSASDYPSAAAMAFVLMGGILAFVAVYAWVVGTEELTGSAV